jgi:hypothetical protein
MQIYTKFLKARSDYIAPHFLITINIVTQHLVVVLLHQTGMDKTQHLQVNLDLNVLVLDDPTEQTVRTVLDLNQGPGPVILLLNPINFSTNYKPGLTQSADVQIVE